MAKFKQDHETGVFIPIDEYEDKYGKVVRRSPQIMKDIESFVSPIDGTIITSRPKLAAHNKEHGVTNIHDYSEGYFEKRGKQMSLEASGKTEAAKKERYELIDKTLSNYGV